MVKKDFINAIYETLNGEMKKKDIEKVIDSLEIVIKDAVKNDETVTIPGICKIASEVVPERSGVSKLGGIEKPWKKPEHKKATVKTLPAFKKMFE